MKTDLETLLFKDLYVCSLVEVPNVTTLGPDWLQRATIVVSSVHCQLAYGSPEHVIEHSELEMSQNWDQVYRKKPKTFGHPKKNCCSHPNEQCSL